MITYSSFLLKMKLTVLNCYKFSNNSTLHIKTNYQYKHVTTIWSHTVLPS